MKITIREPREEELDRLVDIWLEGSKVSHDFIDPHYWEANKEAMRGLYLPLSENYVATNGEEILGFVSMMGEYLSAIFVDPAHQKQGYGKILLDYVKKQRDIIQLKVYVKNGQSVLFYKENGFQITEQTTDEATGEDELVMEWHKLI